MNEHKKTWIPLKKVEEANKEPSCTGFNGSNVSHHHNLSNGVQDNHDVKKNAKQLTMTFEPRTPIYKFSSIVLADNVRRDISMLYSRIINHHLLYEEWGLKKIDPQGTHTSVNFYGPPGTGKTMCAEALAAQMKCDIIDVSYAQIESKYVGETGKNIEAAFKRAKETGALLFFDEADSILGKRMSNVTQGADHAVNVARAVMLKQLDSFEGIVVFATNLFKNFDEAFLRRILYHVEIPLPDEMIRKQLWHTLVPNTVPGHEDLDCNELAKVSDGLSGGYIKNAIVAACSEAVMNGDFSDLWSNEQENYVSRKKERRLTQEMVLQAIKRIKKADNASKGIVSSKTEIISMEEFEKQNREIVGDAASDNISSANC